MNTYLKPQGLPCIRFAHTYAVEQYYCHFPARPERSGSIEITYLARGELIYQVGEEQITILPGDVICTCYREPITVFSSVPHEHHTVGVDMPLVFCDQEDEEALFLPFFLQNQDMSRAMHLIDEIIRVHTMQKDDKITAAGLFLQLLGRIDRQVTRSGEITPAQREYIKRAKAYIFEHLHEPILQNEIAAHLGITPEYLCMIFKKAEGISVVPYIGRIKLKQIRQLMTVQSLSLAQASAQLGYVDPNYVSRLYKKYFGMNITKDE